MLVWFWLYLIDKSAPESTIPFFLHQTPPASCAALTLRTARPWPVTRGPTSASWALWSGGRTEPLPPSSCWASWSAATRPRWRPFTNVTAWGTFTSRRLAETRSTIESMREETNVSFIAGPFSSSPIDPRLTPCLAAACRRCTKITWAVRPALPDSHMVMPGLLQTPVCTPPGVSGGWWLMPGLCFCVAALMQSRTGTLRCSLTRVTSRNSCLGQHFHSEHCSVRVHLLSPGHQWRRYVVKKFVKSFRWHLKLAKEHREVEALKWPIQCGKFTRA